MKKFLVPLLLATATFVGANAATAADLDPPPPPVDDLRGTTYDWTGLYVGAWVGSACIDGTLTELTPTPDREWETAGCGGKGGLVAGYNHQFENFVLGLEGDWGITDWLAKNEEDFGAAGVADFQYGFDHIVTLRARAGYAFDDTLLYVTGGAAWAKGNVSGIEASVPDNLTQDHWGWTIGGGVEHAVTDHFRLRLDYLYTKLGTENYQQACCNLDIDTGSEHEIRLGAIWSFASW